MSPLLPRKLSVQQGTALAPVKTPAEDWRLNDGALWTPGGSQFQERSGIVAGAGPSAGVEPLAVTAAAGAVLTIQPGRFFVQGSAALQGGYLGTVDQVTTRTIAGTDLPASGSFKAGYLGIKVYDQVYSDTQDGADLIYLLGASASTANSAALPALPTSFLQLRAFTVDSTGTVTFGSYLPPFTVPRGGVLPVRVTDGSSGSYVGQVRDHPTYGQQRWSGTTWTAVKSVSTDWQLVPLVSSMSHNNLTSDGVVPGPGPAGWLWRREGDRIFTRGVAYATAAIGNYGIVATVPAEARPDRISFLPVWWELSTSKASTRLDIAANGNVYAVTGLSANTYLFFDGTSHYSLT